MNRQSIDGATVRPTQPDRSLTTAKRQGGAERPIRGADRLAAWAVWALLLAGVAAEMLGQTQLVSFGFYTLHVVDPAVVLMFLACGATQAARLPRGGAIVLPVIVIAGLTSLSFVRGMMTDPTPALLWARVSLAIVPFSCCRSPARSCPNSTSGSAARSSSVPGCSACSRCCG